MSQFGTPFRQNKPPKEIAEKPLRSDLTTAPFPRYSLQTLSPILPVPHIPCPVPCPTHTKVWGGDLDGGTVGDLCFIFRFKALSHNRKSPWDRDTEETSQGQIVESGVDRVFS